MLKSMGVRHLCFSTMAAAFIFTQSGIASAQRMQAPRVQASCDYSEISAPEFVFSEADERMRRFGYLLWHKSPSVLEEPLEYGAYVNRRGKLLANVINADNRLWHVAVMENCEKIFAERNVPGAPFQGLKHLEYNGRVYFRSGLLHAKRLVNKDIWVNETGLEVRQKMYTADPRISYPLSHGQRLQVIGVDTKRYAHTKGVGPFFLRVRDDQGRDGLLKFNEQYFYESANSVLAARKGPDYQPTIVNTRPGTPIAPSGTVRIVPAETQPRYAGSGWREMPVARDGGVPPLNVDDSPVYEVTEAVPQKWLAPVAPTAPVAPAPSPAPAVAKPAKKKVHNPSGYLVNVMSTQKKAAAEKASAKYIKEGYESRVTPAIVNGKPLYRVQLGSYPTADIARRIAGILDGQGIKGAWVSNAP